MCRTLLATVVYFVPALVYAGDVESDFPKAVVASGAEYVAVRDLLVKASDDDFLKKKAESKNLQEQVVARSVLAWKEHGKLYSERVNANLLLTRFDNVLFLWSSDRNIQKQPEMIPLALEMLIKNSAGEPGMYAGSQIIAATAREGSFKDQDLLFTYLEDMPTFEPGVEKLTGKGVVAIVPEGGSELQRPKQDPAVHIAQAIVGIPPTSALTKRVVELLYKIGKYPNKERASDSERSADRTRMTSVATFLTRYFIRATLKMSPAEKKELITALTSEKELLGAVGAEPTLSAAGAIGGPEASAAILKHLRENSAHGEDKKKIATLNWGFQLLGRMRDESGGACLREYALDSNLSTAGREVALEFLVGLRYSEDTLTAVSSVLEDSSAPASVRFAALRTLDQMFRANRGREEITGPLRKAILETSFSPTDENYVGPVKMIKEIVRETR